MPKSFHNPHGYDAEYILISGGRYKYSGTGQIESVRDMYFAKYPVNNKRYRRFIRYLDKQERDLQIILPVSQFQGFLAEFASSIMGFVDYLGSNKAEWAEKLRSGRSWDKLIADEQLSVVPPWWVAKGHSGGDMYRRFGGDDQLVVDVSWFAAKAYCLWLTELTRAGANSSASQATGVFRLPKDVEWEWAAGAGSREFPWAHEKGWASFKPANYGQAVGTTTPVGSYPDGATPEGLMDMAGNVSEWMDNLYGPGGWLCTWRDSPRQPVGVYEHPSKRYNDRGFRVVRSQS